MKKLTAMIVALVFLLNVIPVAAAPTQTIVEIASANPDFSILVEVVVAAGFDDELSGPGSFTVFAPTNAAFQALLTDLGITKAQLLANPDLRDILLYHLHAYKLMSTDLTDGQEIMTLQGENLTIDLTPTPPRVNDAKITSLDIEATNGVIHVIDKVLIPGAPYQNIVEIASGNSDFSILVEAVVAAGLDDDLSGPGPFTVFAPTNAAFQALLTELGITKAQLLAHPDLADVLLYHVLAGKVMSTDLTDGQTPTTLQGEKLTIDLTPTPPTVNDAGITAVNIEATNGVIHAINKVLIPDSFGAPTQNIVQVAQADPNFSILVEAVVAAGLDDDLSGTGPFTVFAPTNAAFQALLTELGITKAQLLAHPDLADVLLYHVLSGKVMSTDLTDGQTPTTLQGEKLTIDLTPTPPTVNDAGITAVDIEATNGVIHVINKVLVPDSFGSPTQNIVQVIRSNPDFSILVAALQKANLVGALQGTGPFTLFAPTNAAFAALLAKLDITAEELLAQPDLGKVLLHHVISGKVMSTDLINGMEAMTLNNDKLKFNLSVTPPTVNNAPITGVDIAASNGVIHVLGSVMVPANFTLQGIDDDGEVPQTGDSQIYIIAGLFLAGAALLLIGRRRRHNVQEN